MKADAKTETAVTEAFNRLLNAYEARNGRALLSLFALDPDVVLYGTGADEKRIGPAAIKAQFERDWSQSDSATLKFPWHSVSSAGGVALLAADGAAHVEAGGQAVTMPLRATVVFEQRAGKWLVAQAHFSTPAAEQAAGESWIAPSR